MAQSSIMSVYVGNKMRALIIDTTIRQTICKLKATALNNILNAEIDIHMDPEIIRDRNSSQTFTIPDGYRVTYTVEKQPIGPCAHISISVPTANKGPHPKAVELILKEFGMQPIAQSLYAWKEDLSAKHFAVNILQRLSNVSDAFGLNDAQNDTQNDAQNDTQNDAQNDTQNDTK